MQEIGSRIRIIFHALRIALVRAAANVTEPKFHLRVLQCRGADPHIPGLLH